MSDRIKASERLQKLREAGVLDEHEFETQKRSVFDDNSHSHPSVDTQTRDSADNRVILTDEDVSIDNALRGRRQFNIYKFIAVTIAFVYVAITFDLLNMAEDTFSKILMVSALAASHFIFDIIYDAAPIVAMVAVSIILSIPLYLIGTFISGTTMGIVTIEQSSTPVTIDLKDQTISMASGQCWPFAIEAEAKSMLLEGLDAIDLSLKMGDDIAAWQQADRLARPWIYLGAHE